MRRLLAFAGVAAAVMLSGFSGAGDGQAQQAQRAPRHLSLLIGAGNYKHASEWKELKNLKGPRTDVIRMQHALRRWGFSAGAANQQVLVDARASKTGIAAAFAWLARQATDSNDVVVIYYSGHGSWAPDTVTDGLLTRDEARTTPGDTFDEGLVPWDARDPHNPRHLVLDDEIGAWLKRLGTSNVTVIVDACFSGTITRGSPDGSPSAPVARGPQPPQYVSVADSSGMLEGGRVNHTLLTAASAYQLAYEKAFFPGAVVSGVFTRFLSEALDGAAPNTRFDELIHEVRTKVGQGQTPQLEGDRTARIFRVGAGVVVPERGYAITRAAGARRVGLDMGALHGVRKGAVYDVYGPGETEFRAGRLAQVRVDSIFEASSFATILPGARAVPPTGRATLSRVPPGALALNRLRLYVSSSASALRASLARIEWIELTSRAEGSMAQLRKRGAGYQVVVRGHEVPPLRGDDAAGRSIPLGPDSIRAFKGTAADLCTGLRRAYSIAAMDLVRNDQPPAPSRLKVDVRLLPAGAAPTRRASTVDTVYVGEPYRLWAWVEIPDETVQRSRLYLTAALAGYTSAPAVLWPLGAGLPTPLTREQLNTPLPLRDNMVWSAPIGVENFKVVVNSDPYDLRTLVRELPRCPVGPRDETRGGSADPLVVTGWTAIERRVEVHPRR